MNLHHISQALPKIVRIKETAHETYVKDPRWSSASSMERQFALQLLMEVLGKECPVLTVDRQAQDIFYNVQIPRMVTHDPEGVQRSVNMLFVPADYCEVIQHGFMEAS